MTDPTVDLQPLVERLRACVGDEHVITQRHQLRTYESDGLLHYAVTPGAVVLPGTADEAAAVVRACFEHETPFVARGAGSGLSGGALPVADGVVIVMSRMRRVLEIDLENGRVVVEPGVTNVEVSKAVAPTHFYPPDPSSQIVCTIGGNVAENSGGAHCLKYGFTTNYVTSVDAVLSDGTSVTVGGPQSDRPGYDLLGALVGSEGTLALVTRITLRVVPVPEAVRTLVAFFDSPLHAGEAVSSITQAGVIPGAIELMDNLAIQAAEPMANAGFPLDAGAALLVELDGSERECEARFEEVERFCNEAGATEVRIARDDAERQRFWRARKAAFASMGRIAHAYYVQDGVIPRTRLPDVHNRLSQLEDEYGLRVANVFHAGDGNLHPLVCYDRPEDAGRAAELSERILDACLAS